MKHNLIFFIFCCSFFTLCGCMTTDMREVTKVQDNHGTRITFLEEWVGELNEEIRNLSLIIKAEEAKDYITSVAEDTDGITITFTHRPSITLRHGAKGDNGADGQEGANFPTMGVKKFDGRYYWTITTNGLTEYLTDTQGNKISVAGTTGEAGDNGQPGADGQPGVAPVLAVNADGNWTVNGTVVLVNDHPLAATGPAGDKGPKGQPGNGGNGAESSTYFESVDASDPRYVVFSLKDGSTFMLPKWQEVEFALTNSRPQFRLQAGQSYTLAYTGKNIRHLAVAVPEGWQAVADTLSKEITITAPTPGNLATMKDGNIAISADNGQGQQIVVNRWLHMIRTSYRITLNTCNSTITDLYTVTTPDGAPFAEVCYEYVKGYTEVARKRTLVVYPWNPLREEYAAGYVVENGGRINHDGTGYTPADKAPGSAVSIDMEGQFAEEAETVASLTPVPEQVADFDNNVYGIVKIGRLYWMKENFRNITLRKADGTTRTLSRSSDEYDSYEPGSEIVYSWLYDFSEAIGKPIERKEFLVSAGWHIPTSKEITELTTFTPNSRDLCAVSTEWKTAAGRVNTNLTGFGALPGGYINANQSGHPRKGIHTYGEWWSSSSLQGTNNIVLRISYDTDTYI